MIALTNAWEIVALTREGKPVCETCLTPAERKVWDDHPDAQEIMEELEVGIIFASDDLPEGSCCSRCGKEL